MENKILENYILENEYYHHLFTNVENSQIYLIKEKIKESPFLDIVLEFYDFNRIDELINSIPIDHPNRKYIEQMMIQDYLYYKIIENLDLEDYDKKNLKKGLFSSSFEKYKKIKNHPIWMFIDDDLKYLTKNNTSKKARCHFFMDSVDDIRLQREINSLYVSVLMGYTTKDKLSTYYSSTGNLMEDPHDYVTHRLKK